MTLNELDHLQAVKNQLLRKRDALRSERQDTITRIDAQLRKLEDQIKSLSEIQGTLSNAGEGETIDTQTAQTIKTKGYLTDALNRFLNESGKTNFTAAEAVHYLKELGFQNKYLYNSTFDALKRMVSKGQLRKEEGKFVVSERQE